MTTIDELHRAELARHVADLTHDLIAAEQRAKDAEREAEEYGRHAAESAFEIVRLQEVVAAAQGAINCIDDDDPVTIHDNGGGSCLHELRAALKKFNKAKKPATTRRHRKSVPT